MTPQPLFKTLLCALLAAAAASLEASGKPKGGTLPPAESKAAGVAAEPVRTMLRLLESLKGLEPTRAYLEWGLTGGPLEGHLVNGHRIGPRADLRGANLRWADLRRCNLEGADLRGADLTGARLGSALLQGANLEGAQLYLADIAGAMGLDLKGAQLHPFFEVDEDEPIGAVKILRLSDQDQETKALPRNLVCGPDGQLFWTLGDGPVIQTMSPTGETMNVTPSGDTRMQAMVKDSQDRMWCFGDRKLSLFDLRVVAGAATGTLFETDCANFPLASTPNQVTAGTAGEVWLSLPGRALQMNFDRAPGKFDHTPYVFKDLDPAIADNSRVVPSRDGNTIFFASPDSPRVFAWRKGAPKTAWLDLYTHKAAQRVIPSKPQRIVMGPDDRVWITQTGVHGVTEIYPDPGGAAMATELHPVTTGKLMPGPHGIAIGPDAKMWFTATTGGHIGRIGPEGKGFQLFELPPGIEPLEIVRAHDGRLFFTMAGRNAIGSIRAEVRPATRERRIEDRSDREAITRAPERAERKADSAPAEPEASAGAAAEGQDGWAGELYRPKPGRIKPATQAQRWQAHLELEQLAEQRRQARQAEEQQRERAGAAASAADAEREEPVELEEFKEPKADSPAPSGPPRREPVLRLWEEKVYLTGGAVRHIQWRHGKPSRKPDSQFAAAYWSREALEQLIADGMLESGAIGKELSRRNPELDRSASFFTRCRRKEVVGVCHTRAGARVETRSFEVCTLRCWKDGVEVNVVKTAYPVLD